MYQPFDEFRFTVVTSGSDVTRRNRSEVVVDVVVVVVAGGGASSDVITRNI